MPPLCRAALAPWRRINLGTLEANQQWCWLRTRPLDRCEKKLDTSEHFSNSCLLSPKCETASQDKLTFEARPDIRCVAVNSVIADRHSGRVVSFAVDDQSKSGYPEIPL